MHNGCHAGMMGFGAAMHQLIASGEDPAAYADDNGYKAQTEVPTGFLDDDPPEGSSSHGNRHNSSSLLTCPSNSSHGSSTADKSVRQTFDNMSWDIHNWWHTPPPPMARQESSTYEYSRRLSGGHSIEDGRVLPVMRFSPYVWSKLIYLRDKGHTEVSGYLLMAAHDDLYVVDLIMVPQVCSSATTRFTDLGVAQLSDVMLEAKIDIRRWRSFWAHTHPGNCPKPSGTDEQTFSEVFGGMDYAVMFILAKDDSTYCRLRYNTGPKLSVELATRVDFSRDFPAPDRAKWDQEYDRCVRQSTYSSYASSYEYDKRYRGNYNGSNSSSSASSGHPQQVAGWWKDTNGIWRPPSALKDKPEEKKTLTTVRQEPFLYDESEYADMLFGRYDNLV